jgi:beta-phosphoglucomutase family hydrolase
MRFDALLFDMDGTLTDSMPLHDRSWVVWHEELGLPFDPNGFFEATAGRSITEIVTDMMREHRPGLGPDEIDALGERKEALFREIARRELQLIRGAAEVLATARAQGLKLAICTGAPHANVAVAAERFGLDRQVDTIVSPDDGLRGKPHPDLFLEAARRLQVEPTRCLVFEDAPLGLEAARRGGMAAVALTTSLPAAAFAEYDNLLHCIADFQGYTLPTDRTARD